MKSRRVGRTLCHTLGGVTLFLIICGFQAGTVYALAIPESPQSQAVRQPRSENEPNNGSKELLWRFATDGPVYSSPAVVEGVLYVGSMDGHLYALDIATGDLRWRFHTGPGFISSPAIAEGVVYIGSHDGHVYALHAANGDLLWRYATDGPVFSSPSVVKSVVYAGSMDGHLYALDAATGNSANATPRVAASCPRRRWQRALSISLQWRAICTLSIPPAEPYSGAMKTTATGSHLPRLWLTAWSTSAIGVAPFTRWMPPQEM